MSYKVTKQFGTGRENPDRTFNTLNDAKAYSNQCAESDAAMKIQTIYRVYEFDDVVHEVDSTKIAISSQASDQVSGSAGKQSGATFKPTPFEMAPRPKGTPQKWIHDEDEKKEDK